MGIKFKAIIIISISVIILMLAEHVIMNTFFLNSILDQEKNAVVSEVRRAESLLSKNKEVLEISVKDWAPWDDTLQFIQDLNQDYIDANFSESTIENLTINLIVFFDRNGKIKYSIRYDSKTQQKFELKAEDLSVLEKNKDYLCTHTDIESSKSGMIALFNGAALVATAPITDSNFQHPGGGTLLFGRYVDKSLLAAIAELTHTEVLIKDISKLKGSPEDSFTYRHKAGILEANQPYVISLNREKVRGYSVITGLDNKPLYFLQLNLSRDIYNHGKITIYFFELISFVIFILITIICIALIHRSIVKPIVTLSAELQSLDVNKILRYKPSGNNKDEISTLINTINEMLKNIQEKKEIEKELAYLSIFDKLTGLYNRGYFEFILEKMMANELFPLTIIIGDINGLKITNDTFGHHVGDKIITAIAENLKKACSEEDLVSRWGGDEFAIILPQGNDQAAEEVCNRVRENCLNASDGTIVLNISLGYSTIRNKEQKIQDVIKEAEDRMYRNKLFESKSARNSIISSLQRTLTERSNETEEHTTRMYELCIKVGKKLNLSKAKTDELALLAFLHDIGKIAIPDHILNKPGSLNKAEWEIMKTHTEIGYRIAAATHELSHISYGILSHHENYDGSGYPKGIKEMEIPIISRIISILDTYDVMTHGRVYKTAVSKEAAIEELRRCSGTQFDPELVETCIEVLQEEL